VPVPPCAGPRPAGPSVALPPGALTWTDFPPTPFDGRTRPGEFESPPAGAGATGCPPCALLVSAAAVGARSAGASSEPFALGPRSMARAFLPGARRPTFSREAWSVRPPAIPLAVPDSTPAAGGPIPSRVAESWLPVTPSWRLAPSVAGGRVAGWACKSARTPASKAPVTSTPNIRAARRRERSRARALLREALSLRFSLQENLRPERPGRSGRALEAVLVKPRRTHPRDDAGAAGRRRGVSAPGAARALPDRPRTRAAPWPRPGRTRRAALPAPR
jgi:hypothetical protein